MVMASLCRPPHIVYYLLLRESNDVTNVDADIKLKGNNFQNELTSGKGSTTMKNTSKNNIDSPSSIDNFGFLKDNKRGIGGCFDSWADGLELKARINKLRKEIDDLKAAKFARKKLKNNLMVMVKISACLAIISGYWIWDKLTNCKPSHRLVRIIHGEGQKGLARLFLVSVESHVKKIDSRYSTMAEPSNTTFEEREEFMVSLNGDSKPTLRTAHFLKPTTTSMDETELPLVYSISPLPSCKNWSLKVRFTAWRHRLNDWNARVTRKLMDARLEISWSRVIKVCQWAWMKKFINSGSEIEQEAFLALWLSRCAFQNPSQVIKKEVLTIATRRARGNSIALAPAVRASIYRDLNELKRAIVADNNESILELFSPLQLVQLWAWERFPVLLPKPSMLTW
ncbi:unnamed protein product [Dovyalis caffra]|uniref:Aminotransferase-like plant mobile domain-containing protein n=1 Tax=Dovyalis caffra TaxID=77055 RepID=A0AAV1RRN5_9ROSI|nr:unnamed protein product [Dovyalis caffra]